MNAARWFQRREDYQPPQTPADSPFRKFDVKCGRLRVVHVKGAASGDELHESGGAVVVVDIERKGQAALSVRCPADGETQHPDNIPQPSGLVLGGDAFRHGHKGVKDGAGEEKTGNRMPASCAVLVTSI